MNLTCEQLNPGPCKTYRISNNITNDIVLIDPVIEHIGDYQRLIEKEMLNLNLVIDTHTHADHISGGASLKDIFSCSYAMHTNSPVKCSDFRLQDGFTWKLFDKIPVKVLHSPGHTRDSITLIFPEWIFTGDALFLDDGGAGRDDLPGGDPSEHYSSLRKIRELPEELIVYPAHDYRQRKSSSLRQQKKTNPHLLKCLEGRDVFVHYLEDLKLGPADWMTDVLKVNYACARDPKAAWIPTDSPACEIKGTMDLGVNDIDIASIPPSVLRQKLNDTSPPVLLDVREKKELDGPLGHLDGIVNIPIGSLTSRLDELKQYQDKEIVTVCRSGGRAGTAAQIMTVAGFTKIVVLEGGMTSWNSQEISEVGKRAAYIL